jgi:hypothetical protein
MTKRSILTILVCGIAMSIIPTLVFAVGTDLHAGGAAINKHADDLSKILFGPVAKTAAFFGGVIGVIYGLCHHSWAQMLTFGGIALVSVGLPTFINGLYTLLLP